MEHEEDSAVAGGDHDDGEHEVHDEQEDVVPGAALRVPGQDILHAQCQVGLQGTRQLCLKIVKMARTSFLRAQMQTEGWVGLKKVKWIQLNTFKKKFECVFIIREVEKERVFAQMQPGSLAHRGQARTGNN